VDETQELAELIVALEHGEEAVRFNAAVELALRQHEAALPELIRSLGHESWVIRHYHAHRALQALGMTAVTALRAALETDGRERACAAHTLYRLAPTEEEAIVTALALALRASDTDVRSDALHVLAEIGAPARSAAPELSALLQDPTETAARRAGAARALTAMDALGSELLPALVEVLGSENWSARHQLCGVLADLGEAAYPIVPDLRVLLANPAAPVGVRVDAAQLLATLRPEPEQNVAALTDALQDGEWWVRLYAARALGMLGADAATATPALIAALQDTEPNVSRNAAWALAEIGEAAAEATPALIRALERDEVAGVAAEALARIGGPALSALQRTLQEGTPTVRRMAAYALGKMDVPEAAATLERWQQESGEKPFTPSYADFFLPAPEITLDSARIQDFETQLQETLAHGEGSLVDYRSTYPKYEFLAYMVHEKGCVLHGSNRQDIAVMNPTRRSLEAESGNPLGNINGVYATPDPIWPMFFAIVDRIRYNVWLINGPLSGPDATGTERPFYHFSINVESLRERPYTEGMVYILPGETFENAGGAERASRTPVRPLMKLAVSPADFPMLVGMRGFDSRQGGWLDPEEKFLFLDEVRKYPVRALPDKKGAL